MRLLVENMDADHRRCYRHPEDDPEQGDIQEALDAIDVTALGKRTYEETKTALEWHANLRGEYYAIGEGHPHQHDQFFRLMRA